MKTINFVSKLYILSLTLFFINIPLGICGSGGGSGIPITPFKKNEIITEEKINQIKNINKPVRIALLPKTPDNKYGDNYLDGAGFIYLKDKKKLQYSEQLDNLPEDFEFDNFGIDKLSFDKISRKLNLNGLMTIQERNKLANGMSTLTSDRYFSRKLRTAVYKLYFLPRIKDGAVFFIEGYTESGDKQIVYLNELEKLKILKVDKDQDKLLISVVKFPDISPNELLSLKPTYTELKENYSTELKIWVNTKNEKDEKLFIAEIFHKDDQRLDNIFGINMDWFNEKEYFLKTERMMLEFQKHDEIKFWYENRNIWWAIPSVTNDIEYPYRYQLAH